MRSRLGRDDRRSLGAAGQLARLALRSIATLPLSAPDTGQPSFVASAILRNVGASMLATLARTVSTMVVILKPSPTLSMVQAALVSMRCGGVPFFSKPSESAML